MNSLVQVYQERRQRLAQMAPGAVILVLAGFENERNAFLQSSSFFYLTGISEPGVALLIYPDGTSSLFIPQTNGLRAKWVAGTITPQNAENLGIERIEYLGTVISGYEPKVFIKAENYANLLGELQRVVEQGLKLLAVDLGQLEPQTVIAQLVGFNPKLKLSLGDASSLVAQLRRTKSDLELDHLYQAIEVTNLAQEAAATSIFPGAMECEVQAALEYVFTSSGCGIAFPSIVGSGKNSTVLHYNQNSAAMQDGDLVVVDIGARYRGYCADITRTYPVNGKFTERQLEIYELVLKTQAYVAELAMPGMWLSNAASPEQSLVHLAREFMREHGGYDQYFIHGIGHYLGLDTHDVGDTTTPLQPGDVFTIEPGIYISEEKLGVRIEDNYWMTEKGVVCLSESIAKEPQEIEALVASKW